MTITHIIVRFREGYPELNPLNYSLVTLREAACLQEDILDDEIHASVFPLPGESVSIKRRMRFFRALESSGYFSDVC